MDAGMIVRASTPDDADALAAIYGWHVAHGFGTFEEVPPSPAEMAARRAAIVGKGLPHVVGEREGRVIGFAYAAPFRPRAAYRYTLEDSVYVAQDAQRTGVGTALLSAVLDACANLGVRQVMAVIGDSGNAGSIGLHQALGFEQAGRGEALGYKHGRWVDIVWMRKALNGGAAMPPSGPGVSLP